MFVLLILAIRFFSHQSKQESKTIIIDDETMNSNSKMEKNSHSFTIHLNDQKPALLENTIFEGLEKITDRSQWYVTANCWQADNAQSKEGPPKYIIDGDYESRWHSRYNMNSGGEGAITPPFYFIVDLNETVQLGGFQYGPRRKGSANGCFPNYRLYTGSSIEDVKKKIQEKKFTTNGTFTYPDGNNKDQSARLNVSVECSVVALQTDGKPQGKGLTTAVCSDFNVYVYPRNETESPIIDLIKVTNRSKWYVIANNWQADNGIDEGPPKYIIDGNNNTLWHSRYNDAEGGGGNFAEKPFYFIIDLNEKVRLGGFQYGPRRNGPNGLFKEYKLYTGSSISEVEDKISKKNYTKEGTFTYQNPRKAQDQFVLLDEEVECSVVALESNGTSNGQGVYTGVCSDFNIFINPTFTNVLESPK